MKKDSLYYATVKMRIKGYSLREISERMNISKSTASLWLSKVKIGVSGRKRLEKIKENAIAKTRNTKKRQKEIYLKDIERRCTVLNEGGKYNINDLKVFLALLYWGEGSKSDRRVVFMNSDPILIKTYLNMLRKAFHINDKKLKGTLHLHNYHDKSAMITYWSRITKINAKKISVYNKQNSGQRKKR